MRELYQFLARSDHWLARFARACNRFLWNFSIPAPKLITLPVLYSFLTVRELYYFIRRTFFCEPLFKSYCTSYGKNLHTGIFLHWVQGKGKLIVGDNVTIGGRCSFFFASRYSDSPTLTIGDNTGMGHQCSFTVGKSITIGRNVRLAAGIQLFDSPGHPIDPVARAAGMAADADDVRPIVIEDNVWIGSNAIVFPGVTIGENSVVATGAVVMNNIPANVVVAGNPARQIRAIPPPVLS
jgi:acetyltransferase-like isoleucine patch superfamily enzyme